MKNKFIYSINSKVSIYIIGNNPDRIILRLHKKKINIYKINKITKEKVEIIIDYNNFEKILKLNTIYDIKINNYLGLVKIKKQLFKYYYVIIIAITCIIYIYFLSNMIFNVEIITNDLDMKTRLSSTLKKYDIKKYKLKKNYNYIQKVKNSILEEYHDDIEWVEIECVGTKYIIKYEPKVIKKKEDNKEFRHIIAKKNAIINKIYSSNGQVMKNKYSYVKKGDIIISGYIYLNDKIKSTTSAEGKVYGEVWYITNVVYPFNYYEKKKTGNKKIVYSVKFFDKNIELFNLNKFNDKIVDEYILLKGDIFPIKLVKEKQEEVIIKTSMNSLEETKLKAIDLAYTKMKQGLKNDEYIINYRVLDSKIIDKGVEMKIFFSVCEDIGEYLKIEEMKEVE